MSVNFRTQYTLLVDVNSSTVVRFGSVLFGSIRELTERTIIIDLYVILRSFISMTCRF